MTQKRKKYWNQAEMGWWEKVYYFEILRGLKTTFRVFIRNLFKFAQGKRGALTTYYPEEIRPDYAPNFRGRHYLPVLESGRPACIGCKLCENICPAKCISMVVVPSAPGDTYSPKTIEKYQIDYATCIFCGFCVDICPKDAILQSKEVINFPDYTREALVFKMEDLLEKRL